MVNQRGHLRYDEIGVGYSAGRRDDPLFAASLASHLRGSASVANIGAGTGSYEGVNCVVAVEPSRVMLESRTSPVPAVQAAAEFLPLRSKSVDASTAIMTVQHWTDLSSGLAEMSRIARRTVVVLAYVPGEGQSSWLSEDYFPTLDALNDSRFRPLSEYSDALGAPTEVLAAEISRDCRDGFLDAYWARPEAYLDDRVQLASSSLRSIAGDPGWARLRDELAAGEWDRKYGHVRTRESIDLGYRWLVWRDL